MTAETEDSKDKRRQIPRRNIELDNPCVKEMHASLKCIERNYGDQDRCQKYFDNYKLCNDFWRRVRLDRQRKGIKPYLPSLENRDQVRDEYRKAWKY